VSDWSEYDTESASEFDTTTPPERSAIVAYLRNLADHIERDAPMIEPQPPACLLRVKIGYAPTAILPDTRGPVPLVAIWRGEIAVDGPEVEIDLHGIGLPPDIAIGRISLDADS